MLKRIALAVVLTAASATAQNTFIVSATPGPDVDFINLPGAVQAAVPGDEIIIRTGVYTPPRVDKGLRIRGEGSVTFVDGQFLITDLPANQTVVLQNLDLTAVFNGNPSQDRLSVSNCDGVVHCQGLTIDYRPFPPVRLGNADRVSFHDCRIAGVQPVSIVGSSASFSACEIRITEPAGSGANIGASGISLLGGKLSISGSTVEAPGGSTLFQQPLPVIQCGGSLRIGGSDSEVIATGVPGLFAPIPAILVNNGPGGETSALVDPSVTVTGANGGPAILDASVPGNPVGFASVPAAVLRTGPAGDFLDLTGPPGEMWAQFCSPFAHPINTPVGIVWSDVPSLVVLGIGFYDGTGKAVANLPPTPAMLSAVMSTQTLVLRPSGFYVGVPTIALLR